MFALRIDPHPGSAVPNGLHSTDIGYANHNIVIAGIRNMPKTKPGIGRKDILYLSIILAWTALNGYEFGTKSIEVYKTIGYFDFWGDGVAAAAQQELLKDTALRWGLGMAGIIGAWLIGVQLRRFQKGAADRKNRAPHRMNDPT